MLFKHKSNPYAESWKTREEILADEQKVAKRRNIRTTITAISIILLVLAAILGLAYGMYSIVDNFNRMQPKITIVYEGNSYQVDGEASVHTGKDGRVYGITVYIDEKGDTE